MHADPKGVLTGVHFLDGDHACCEGTLAAGARFAAGYPITPSTEVVERFVRYYVERFDEKPEMESASISPTIVRRSVVLPAPLRPIRAMRSPGGSLKDTPS